MKKKKPLSVAAKGPTGASAAVPGDAPTAHGPTEAIARQVARKWSASFGVSDATAVQRLESRLAAAAFDALFDRSAIIDLERVLDEAAQLLIGGWFAEVLQKPVGSSTQAFAEARLAFLMVSGGGAWSHLFLDPAVPAADLRQAMETVQHVGTPPQRQQEIRRQSL